MQHRVSAPGKLMIMGEYAVLDGAPAVVTAVDRRAVAWTVPAQDTAPLPPEVEASRHLAEAQAGPLDAGIALDLSALRAGVRKLGLGSSAAGAAAAAGLVLAAQGHDVSATDTRQLLFELAFRGHHMVAPSGSGADVAASVWGGFLRFQRIGASIERPHSQLPVITPLSGLERATFKVVWTGHEARTSDFVAAVQALAERSPAVYRTRMDELTSLARDFIQAAEIGDLSQSIRIFAAYGHGMAALGEAAGVGIVTPALTQVAYLAAQHGGASKPSGAGGGDVALAMFDDPMTADGFQQACERLDLTVLPLALGEHGVSLEPPSHSDVAHAQESGNR